MLLRRYHPVKQEIKPEVKPEVKQEVKPVEVKQEAPHIEKEIKPRRNKHGNNNRKQSKDNV